MAEFEEHSNGAVGEDGSASPVFADSPDGAEGAQPGEAAGVSPGRSSGLRDKLSAGWMWLVKWHPLLFLGVAGLLALAAWMVYPEPQEQRLPSAEELYAEGLDRLYRVMNPDLPLVSGAPVDEAAAARLAFLNLFVLYRARLKSYPQFINPYLLLAEANRQIAGYAPSLADKRLEDAVSAYDEALLWETRDDEPDNLRRYFEANFLEPGRSPEGSPPDSDLQAMLLSYKENEDEITLRRARREEYIRYHRAEASVRLGKVEDARAVLEGILAEYRRRRREELRNFLAGEAAGAEPGRRVFELGPDEYDRLPLLMGMVYENLGLNDRARPEYLNFLAGGGSGQDRAHALFRLAELSLADGRQYRQIDPERARSAFAAAVDYYGQASASRDALPDARRKALLASAEAYADLANLFPEAPATALDELARAGASVRAALERFAGRRLPERSLALPEAIGRTLSAPELMFPGPAAVPGAAGGKIAALASGGVDSPYAERRRALLEAVARFDRIAESEADPASVAWARVMAARESWLLGMADDTERRLRLLLDPLSSEEVNLAARLGLARVGLAKGELDWARLLLLGGSAQPNAVWLRNNDADWQKMAENLGNARNRADPGVWRRLWDALPESGREVCRYAASGRRLGPDYLRRLLRDLNTVLQRRDFYNPEDFSALKPEGHLPRLLSVDAEMLSAAEVVWRNRLLLEASLPYDLAQDAGRRVVSFEPFPKGIMLDPSGQTPPDRVSDAVVALARAEYAAGNAAGDPAEKARRHSAAIDAYRFAVDNYRPDFGVVFPELAAAYERLADVREGQGRHREALELTALSARANYRTALDARNSPREAESLLAAGDAFFRAGLLERTMETTRLFLDRFGYSSSAGSESAMAATAAANLLGRCYWFLGDAPRAIAAFSENLKRRTPDRFKSIYYIGRVMLDDSLAPGGDPTRMGDPGDPMPKLDGDGDPSLQTALQAFAFIRQSEGITPEARAWRWATFDLGRLWYHIAERERAAEEKARAPGGGRKPEQWLPLYDRARTALTEALERYPLRTNGGPGVSVRVEPEDYADVMSARFVAEYLLADTLLLLAAENDDPEPLRALARAHLANLADRSRYASALFDSSLDRFQLNSAVVREAVEGGIWDKSVPLPRSRLGDDEGPANSPTRLRWMLRNGMITLAGEYFRAGDRSRAAGSPEAAEGFYRSAYAAYRDVYDRFGQADGPMAMLGMADSLERLGRTAEAGSHYRQAENIARTLDAGTKADGLLDIGPAFWAGMAAGRLGDRAGGYGLP